MVEPSSGFKTRRIEGQSRVVEQPAAQLDPIQATATHQNEPLPAIERSPRITPPPAPGALDGRQKTGWPPSGLTHEIGPRDGVRRSRLDEPILEVA